VAAELWRLALEIAQAPDDRELQRVYADALIQEGGEHAIRGELIQLELAGEQGPREREVADSLMRARATRGLDGLIGGLARSWVCGRGTFEAHAERAFREEPLLDALVFCIGPTFARYQVERLAGVPQLARVRDLKLVTDERVAAGPGAKGLAALLDSVYFPRQLRALDLHRCALRDDAIALLAASAVLAHLRVLVLSANTLGARAFAALAATPHLTRLELLDLVDTGATRAAVEPIAHRFPALEIRLS
jgi:hypothetical protein